MYATEYKRAFATLIGPEQATEIKKEEEKKQPKPEEKKTKARSKSRPRSKSKGKNAKEEVTAAPTEKKVEIKPIILKPEAKTTKSPAKPAEVIYKKSDARPVTSETTKLKIPVRVTRFKKPGKTVPSHDTIVKDQVVKKEETKKKVTFANLPKGMTVIPDKEKVIAGTMKAVTVK